LPERPGQQPNPARTRTRPAHLREALQAAHVRANVREQASNHPQRHHRHCATAHRWRWIQENPAERIKAPKASKPRPKAPSTDAVGRLVAAAFDMDADWCTMVWLLLVTSVRHSELLRWQLQDVDFNRSMIFVDSTKTDSTSRWVHSTTPPWARSKHSGPASRPVSQQPASRSPARSISTPTPPITPSRARRAIKAELRSWVFA